MTQNCFSYNCFSVVQNIFVQAFVCGKKATRVFSQFPLSGKLRRSLDELAKSFGTVGFPCAQGPGVMGKDGKQADASFFVSLTVGISAYFYLKICIYIYNIYIYIIFIYTCTILILLLVTVCLNFWYHRFVVSVAFDWWPPS